jgi:site-specific DNA-adenine methylase
MTSYHGGKQKTGKVIAKAILKQVDYVLKKQSFCKTRKIVGYCEPFCGMLGVYRHIYSILSLEPKSIGSELSLSDEILNNKIKFKAGDVNESLILMWKRCQKGWVPPVKCSEEYYNKLKYQKKPSAVKGFVGHQYSFGGQYFKGYRGLYKNKDNYAKASNEVVSISTQLEDVNFKYGNFKQYSNLKNHIIYCDPPYSRSHYYFDEEHNRRSFDHIEFWEWCLKMGKNNIVFVSEYSCPLKDKRIKLVYGKPVQLTGSTPKDRGRIENIYMIC